MTEEAAPAASGDGAGTPELSAVETVRALLADAKDAAASEAALLKAGGTLAARALRQFSIWATAALLAAFVGLIALSVGLIMALATVVGPLYATLIVAGLMLLFAAISALRARAATQRIARAIDRILP